MSDKDIDAALDELSKHLGLSSDETPLENAINMNSLAQDRDDCHHAIDQAQQQATHGTDAAVRQLDRALPQDLGQASNKVNIELPDEDLLPDGWALKAEVQKFLEELESSPSTVPTAKALEGTIDNNTHEGFDPRDYISPRDFQRLLENDELITRTAHPTPQNDRQQWQADGQQITPMQRTPPPGILEIVTEEDRAQQQLDRRRLIAQRRQAAKLSLHTKIRDNLLEKQGLQLQLHQVTARDNPAFKEQILLRLQQNAYHLRLLKDHLSRVSGSPSTTQQ